MPNRLAHETSPYLLQHAHNPVDWYPWGEEAFARAKAEGKPVLLSVGYSACHWCHVMERESFEAPAVAEQMNQRFINVKVDREERPDIDEIYMQAVQAFTGGHGGWPMTVFLTPEGEPFFGGTYFPPEPRHGMPSFPQVMQHAADVFQRRKADLAQVTRDLTEHLQSLSRLPTPADALSDRWLEAVAAGCEADFDEEWGGFGHAPKFPPHGSLAVLLAHHHRTGSRRSLEMVTETLDAMARGGMYDLLGGGFARYSVDERWLIPHFEKMLYDNGQLVPVYVDAWKITQDPHYARIVRETCDYVLREMCLPGGAFAAAQDADSEGEEGRFFVWTPAQLREALGLFDGTRAATLLQVTDEGNFEHGTSALRLEEPLERLEEADRALLQRCLPQLFALRAERVAPSRDDKVVTAWNGLMIGALAQAGDALAEPRYLEAAARAARFLLDTVTVEGRLHRSWKDERVGAPGFLDDHANLGQALVDLYEATGEAAWLRASLDLADQTVRLFWDAADGGLFFTGSDAEALITRSKNLMGGATPSGNGVAALWFTRLEELAGRADLGGKAERILRSYQALLTRGPRALGPEALAGAWRTGNALEIGIVGEEPGPLLEALRARYLPFAVRSVSPEPSPLVPWMSGRQARGAPGRAYVCERGSCLLPVTTPAALGKQLDEVTAPPKPKPTARVRAPELPQDPALWLHGGPYSLEQLKGNVVVLDFWTYCCINCMHVLPELKAVEARFAGQPVAVIGVHSAKFEAERDRENVARAARRHGVQHPVLLDASHTIWSQYAVKSWPTLMILDATGRIAWQQSGEVDAKTLSREVQRLLDEADQQGILADTPAWTRPTPEPLTGPLAFPGKVEAWPNAGDQARGAEPFTEATRLYVSDTGHHRVLELALTLDAEGWPRAERLRAWGDGEPGLVDGLAPRFHGPQGLSRDGDFLWVADTENHAIRVIDLDTGEVRTAAGTGQLGRGRRQDPRRPALRSPWDVAAIDNMLFVAMAGTHQIWLLDQKTGRVSPYIGSGAEAHVDGEPDQAALAQPSGLCLVGRYLFWADSETSSIRLLDLAEGKVGTVCGQGLFDFGDVDGVGQAIRLQHPLGVTFADNALYVADTFNHKVKRIALNPRIEATTLAGGEVEVLCEPGGLAALGDFLIVADTNNHRLRVVRRADGAVRDLQGLG
ncbi:MAG: DUF255 domain-containing protein [Alphaproteobacteria bacterium]|nr:DUF255 domain-containing protein [Alphaproteobacteria bacterium]